MNRIRTAIVLCALFALALPFAALANRERGDPRGGHDNGHHQRPAIAVDLLDANNRPLEGVQIYLGESRRPVAVTDMAGHTELHLKGVHSVHFVKEGYRARSYIRRNWDDVTSLNFPLRPTIMGGPTVYIYGSVYNTLSADITLAFRFLRDDGSVWTGGSNAFDGMTPYGAPVGLGRYEIGVFPRPLDIPPDQSYAAYVPYVSVEGQTEGVDLAIMNLARGNGIPFVLVASNGFENGQINAWYSVFTDLWHSMTLAFGSTPNFSAQSIPGAAVTIPPMHKVYPHPRYGFAASSALGPGVNQRFRAIRRTVQSYEDLIALPTIQELRLPDYAVSPVAPLHGTIMTGTDPIFQWTIDGTPGRAEVILTKYVDGAYRAALWQALVYSGDTAKLPACVGTLEPDTAYSYDVNGRTDFTTGTVHEGWEWDGVRSIRFSTGEIPPP